MILVLKPLRLLFCSALLFLAGCASVGTGAAAPRSAFASGHDGVQLHYLDFGGRGDPVLLLPGAGNTAWIYSAFGADLARDYRVLALSRRGHGQSEMPDTGYDQETLADDIRLFLDQQGISKAHLVGHSIAGGELTTFASKYPDRVASVVYLDAAYDRSAQGPVERGSPERPAPPAPADRSSIDAFVAYLFRTRPIYGLYPREVVERDTRASLVLRADGTAGFRMGEKQYAEMLQSLSAGPPDYSQVRVPALAIYAVGQSAFRLNAAPTELRPAVESFLKEKVTPWREASIAQFREGVAQGEVVRMDAVHHLFLQRPQETANLVRRFLSEHPIRR